MECLVGRTEANQSREQAKEKGELLIIALTVHSWLFRW